MARIESSLYEPSDDVRIFDGHEDEEDTGSRLPLLIVIALLVLGAFVGVVWLAYTQGVARGREGAPPILAAASGPVKIAPPDSSGTATPYRGLKIYQQPVPKDDDSDSGASLAAPAPVDNYAANTAAKPAASPPAGTVASAAKNSPPPTSLLAKNNPPPIVVKSNPPPAVTGPTLRAGKPDALAPNKPAPTTASGNNALAQVAVTAPKPPPPVTTSAAPKPAPAANGKTNAAVVMNKTAPLPSAAPGQPLTAPVKTPAASPAPILAQAKPVAAPPAADGAYVLQIGSFKSEAEANASWVLFKAKHSGLVGSYASNVQSVDLGAKGTWYRLRIGSFGDKSAAADACVKLRADGASCLLAR